VAIELETYSPPKHDQDKLAELIFASDPEMNRIVYGEKPLEVIKTLLNVPETYFLPQYTKCVMLDGELVGVVVYYPASKRQEVDRLAGQGFMKAMGFWGFIKRFFLYMKMEKMLGGEIDDDGLYIHTLAVDSRVRGRGIGSQVIRALEQENEKMYLYVNAGNEGAIRFYKRNGFTDIFYGEMAHQGKTYGEFLMEKKGS
jgi:ribosomal protein S18 acetylase RimI-like enzyme